MLGRVGSAINIWFVSATSGSKRRLIFWPKNSSSRMSLRIRVSQVQERPCLGRIQRVKDDEKGLVAEGAFTLECITLAVNHLYR